MEYSTDIKIDHPNDLLRGYQHYRIKCNWRELAIMETWEQYHKDYYLNQNLPHQLMWNSEEYRKLSEKEKIAAIRGFNTALQWLGTNVGHSVLKYSLLKAMGEELGEFSVEQGMTSLDENIRKETIELHIKITEWQKRTNQY